MAIQSAYTANYLVQQQMQSCLSCRQHLEDLKKHAQLLIHSQHSLLSQNDTLTSTLGELSIPSQEQKLWKSKYEKIFQINAKLEESLKKGRVVNQKSQSKRSQQNRGCSTNGSLKRSGSVGRMEKFIKKVMKNSRQGLESMRKGRAMQTLEGTKLTLRL